MKTDLEIQKDVRDELKWDSRIDGSEISVEVKDGTVSIAGTVNSCAKKRDAERTAGRVAGVKNLLNLLKVKIPEFQKKSDSEIEQAIVNAMRWNSSIDENKISVSVQNGQVTLEGEVPWEYQKSKLRNLAADTIGVLEVINLVRVVPKGTITGDTKGKIDAALRRNHYLNTNRIKVLVQGNKAILTGEVRSIGERGAAETAAWSAPGINEVENRLLVSFSEIFA